MIFSSLFSLLFSFLMVLGYSFSKTHSFQFFDSCKSFISFCVISLIAFGIMYAVLSRMSVPKESELSKNCRKVRHPFFFCLGTDYCCLDSLLCVICAGTRVL